MEQENKTPAPVETPAEEDSRGDLPRVFIVGLGQTGRELLFRLMRSVPVVGLDLNESKLEQARRRVNEGAVKLARMDATSRLTWNDLKLDAHDTVVAAARRDEVNLEACRIAAENFGVKKLYGLIHSTRRSDEYAAAGIETVSRAQVLASFMESKILKDRRTAMNVGQGQGEIMEVTIMPGSPVIGRPLSSYHARPWLVAAVYRKDQLIVPHGNTVIREGDRVVLIGEPHLLAGVADFFKLGEPEFPLQYGPRIGVMAGVARGESYDQTLAESNYLAMNSKATSMVVLSLPGDPEPDLETAQKICGGTGLSCEPAYFPDEEDGPWPMLLQAQDYGCLVLGGVKLGLFQRLGLTRSLLGRLLADAKFPILISRGTHPYKKILAPVVGTSNPHRLAELAINLARLFEARLDAITVTEPAFAAGKEEVEEQKRVLDRVVEHSALYRKSIRVLHLEGNPIHEVVKQSQGYNLLVLGYRRGKRRLLPRLDLTVEILSRVSCSAMILPYQE